MTEDRAKRQLARMLRSFTAGSVLHLLADICRESAQQALRRRDERLHEQLQTVEAALVVVGCGVDAILPR
jgi:hypothetical protein